MARVSATEVPGFDDSSLDFSNKSSKRKSSHVRLVRVEPILSPNPASHRISSADPDRSPSSLSRIYLSEISELPRPPKKIAVVTRDPSTMGLNIDLISTNPSPSSRKKIGEMRSVSKLSRHSLDALDEDWEDPIEPMAQIPGLKKVSVPETNTAEHVIVTKSVTTTHPVTVGNDRVLGVIKKPLIHRIIRRHFFSKDVNRKDKMTGNGKIPAYWNDFCPCCSFWLCLLLTSLISLLLLAGFITALVLLLANRTTSNPTTSTSTTVPTPTITTTSTASITSTSATTITTTVGTCTSGWSNVVTLYDCINCNSVTSYTTITTSFTAIASQTRIAFAFEQDKGCFGVDNISVQQSSTPGVELLQNPSFETGDFTGWTYCNATNPTDTGRVISTATAVPCAGPTGRVQNGNFAFYEISQGSDASYLSQVFNTIAGSSYTITFWFYKIGPGQGNNVNVTISI